MSGLFALLDDVAAIAKVAAASLDDVAGQAAKAGAKTAGVLIDDAAVTPQYLEGFDAKRELPIVWRITKGSIRNKILILLPLALLLSSFAPWAVTPLLMLGGAYLSFEGAEKVLQKFLHHDTGTTTSEGAAASDPAHLEETKVRGAIKTDFILSAEIMTISLAAIPESNIWMEAAVLASVGIGITALVYGSVAIIVKSDDVGLHMATRGRLRATRALGRGIVRSMPSFMKWLTIIGTAAMLWVGGSIIIHGLDKLGWTWPWEMIEKLALSVGHLSERLGGLLEWTVEAGMFGLFGLVLGVVLVPLITKGVVPLWRKLVS